jgi:predicted HicB family RNase H-like nuclease
MHVKVRPSVKALAETMAADDRRSLTSWLELLIEAEAERRKPGGATHPGKGR